MVVQLFRVLALRRCSRLLDVLSVWQNKDRQVCLPARATRPTRCTNSLGVAGKSQLMTLSRSGMSIPRAATSVTISTSDLSALNFAILIFRALWSMDPYLRSSNNKLEFRGWAPGNILEQNKEEEFVCCSLRWHSLSQHEKDRLHSAA